jgi:ribonuclease D
MERTPWSSRRKSVKFLGYNCFIMSSESLPGPIFIARPPALRRLAENLLREPIVAVDTESNSLYVYQEQVCLIQFSTPRADFLVDPLALGDLSPLALFFSHPGIEKVFHAAEYDLLCLKRDFGFDFANIFDTMIAARTLGYTAIGLGSLLEAEFGIHLDKRQQRANWGQRPVPGELLTYAQLDTHYLAALRQRLYRQLVEKGLWELALEDFNRTCRVMGGLSDNKNGDCWRINGAHELTPQKVAVLAELCTYRDQVARAINRPLFKVISDRTLLAIADECPLSLDQLERIHGMSRLQMERHGQALLDAVQRGLAAEPVYPPRHPRPDDQYLARLETLRNWRKTTAQDLGVSSDVVLPRDLLLSIAGQDPHKPEDLAQVMSEVPWRLEQFGEQILEILTSVTEKQSSPA